MACGHVADLVQEERAAVGVLEAAFAVGAGVGEGAFDVAEQLVLEDAFGRSPAQFSATSRCLRRRLLLWIARAISSLPVPLSPMISTGMSLAATCRAVWTTLLHRRRWCR